MASRAERLSGPGVMTPWCQIPLLEAGATDPDRTMESTQGWKHLPRSLRDGKLRQWRLKLGQQKKGKTREQLREPQRKTEPEQGLLFWHPTEWRSFLGPWPKRTPQAADAEVATG